MITMRDLQGIPEDLPAAGVIIQYLDEKVAIEHHLHQFVYSEQEKWFECRHVYLDGFTCGERLRWGGAISSWSGRPVEVSTRPPVH